MKIKKIMEFVLTFIRVCMLIGCLCGNLLSGDDVIYMIHLFCCWESHLIYFKIKYWKFKGFLRNKKGHRE